MLVEDLFPVLPFRAELYTPAELFAGFSVSDPESYARTTDFRAYRSTLLVPDRDVGMLRALHDQSVETTETPAPGGPPGRGDHGWPRHVTW